MSLLTLSIPKPFDFLRPALAAVAIALSACGGHAATTTATPETAKAVIDAAKGGDTITLAPGDYAPMRIDKHVWSPPLTIEASAARLAQVAFNDVTGVVWHGGTFDGKDTTHTGWSAGTSDHVTIDGATFRHFTRNGIIIGKVSDARITNNTITDSGSDGIDIAESRRVLIDHNECRDTLPTPGAHPDCIQLWSRPTSPPVADITITNNKASGDTQGITMFNHIRGGVDDGGFDRVRVENNTIAIKEWHGIAMYSCRECVIRNNRVDTIPNGRIKAWIKSADSDGVKACGNVATAWSRSVDKRCSE
ncbi:right-handed parallel beta-helix repeat-containing protein [Glacieibacterium megasporae]|uniref:right-handed parallel beta-helix repeat-containing protein n=1 Tax=Glacieibacterium megasporae TaxID=2835787 RepID=UPI001C1DF29B|nr:right-handed parallel beta-helix repeat-containing protein [Polymorphobacter megasporae]UAJ10376.1 right-handed parallel beta-helix repeat-containing protein [Polymorphobacter megasporae]